MILIISRANANEKIAASFITLKGNYKKFIRKGSGMQKMGGTELDKSVNSVGEAPASRE